MKGLAAAIVALALSGAAVYAGGWCVVTVEDLPKFTIVNRPVTLTFAVRVHGFKLADGLPASFKASQGEAVIEGSARPTGAPGRYEATFTPSARGKWSVTLNSGYGASPQNIRQLVLRVLGVGDEGPDHSVHSQVEWGRQLFNAKGCVTCHTHDGAGSTSAVGPRLDRKTYDAAFVRMMILKPDSPAAFEPPKWRMPNMGLSEEEAASLSAFVAGWNAVTERARRD